VHIPRSPNPDVAQLPRQTKIIEQRVSEKISWDLRVVLAALMQSCCGNGGGQVKTGITLLGRQVFPKAQPKILNFANPRSA